MQESSVGVYAQNTTHWTDWMRTIAGIRGDYFTGRVNSDTPANSGSADGFIGSPKFSLVFGPFDKTEFFFNAGYGFHSNDVRGATITVDPNDRPRRCSACRCWCARRAPRSACARRRSTGSTASVALFVLDYDSELLFVGDAGTTEPSRPSRRVGVEWTNHYKVNSWLGFDVDFAYTRARFTDVDPAGDHIPGAPA